MVYSLCDIRPRGCAILSPVYYHSEPQYKYSFDFSLVCKCSLYFRTEWYKVTTRSRCSSLTRIVWAPEGLASVEQSVRQGIWLDAVRQGLKMTPPDIFARDSGILLVQRKRMRSAAFVKPSFDCSGLRHICARVMAVLELSSRP